MIGGSSYIVVIKMYMHAYDFIGVVNLNSEEFKSLSTLFVDIAFFVNFSSRFGGVGNFVFSWLGITHLMLKY